MALYLVNATKQNHRFQWRMPESRKVVHFQVPTGHQIRVDEGLNSGQIDDLIQQMERYGFKRVEDVSRLKDFDGMLFGPKTLQSDDIAMAHEAVVQKQEKRSAGEATRAALGLEKGSRDKRNSKQRLAKEVTVEIEQHVDQRHATGDEIKMSLTVAADGSNSTRLPE